MNEPRPSHSSRWTWLAFMLWYELRNGPFRSCRKRGGRRRARAPGGYGTIFRSLFGEPVPGLVTTPDVAPPTRALDTVAGEADGCPAR